jgi:hypothetical protein
MKKTILKALLVFVFSAQFVAAQCSGDGHLPFFTSTVKLGTYHDISVNKNGTLWAVGSAGVQLIIPGGLPCSTVPSNLVFPNGESVSLGAVAAAPDGSVYVVTNANHVYHLGAPGANCVWPAAWQSFPGSAKDIAVTNDGKLWVIGTFSTGGGFVIYYWTGSAWQSVPGGAVRIAAATTGTLADNQPWVVNSSNTVFHRSSTGSWQSYPGKAFDIGLDQATGLPWIIGTFVAHNNSSSFVMYLWTLSGGWLTDPGFTSGNLVGGTKITGGLPNACFRNAYFLDANGNIGLVQASQ